MWCLLSMGPPCDDHSDCMVEVNLDQRCPESDTSVSHLPCWRTPLWSLLTGFPL